MAVAGDTIVVGASGEDSGASGVDGDQSDNSTAGSGAAYVFRRSGTNWAQQAYLKASNPGAAAPGNCCGDGFASVALFGDTVVVGAPGEDSNATGVDGNQSDNSTSYSGAVYIFTGLEIPTSVPSLKANRSGDSLVISWPESTNDFQLESTVSAGTGSVWENVATSPVVIGDEQIVTVDIGPGSQFFRLRKP